MKTEILAVLLFASCVLCIIVNSARAEESSFFPLQMKNPVAAR